MPVNTQAVIDGRREEVEQAMLSLDWSLRIQNTLASRHGVTVRQIRQDAKKIRDGWARNEKELTPDAKADWLARCRSGQAMAIRGDYPMAYVHLMRLEAQCRGILAPIQQQVEVTHAISAINPLEQAKQIVEAYPEAKRYVDSAGSIKQIIQTED